MLATCRVGWVTEQHGHRVTLPCSSSSWWRVVDNKNRTEHFHFHFSDELQWVPLSAVTNDAAAAAGGRCHDDVAGRRQRRLRAFRPTVVQVTSSRRRSVYVCQQKARTEAWAYLKFAGNIDQQEAQLMLTTDSTRLAVSRGQQTWYHSTCYI